MFRNYIKTSYRSLMKNPLSSFINVFGLSAAIGICIFSYSFYKWTYDRDQFHENRETVFLSTFTHERDGQQMKNGRVPQPLVQQLAIDFPSVEKYCRIEDRSLVVKYDDNVFHERVRLVDPSFLQMLTFPLSSGRASSLKDPNSIILSSEASLKYFGSDDPIGQQLILLNSSGFKKSFTIEGVAEEFPSSKSIGFDFLINFENLRLIDSNVDQEEWSAFYKAGMIQVTDQKEISTLMQKMHQYVALQNTSDAEVKVADFHFIPLASLHLVAEEYEDIFIYGSGENVSSIFFLSAVSIFMMLIASLNYVNIAIVSATKRLNEIGVRKSIGATRHSILIQFLAENLLVASFAIGFGLLLGGGLFIPWFESLWTFEMGFTLNDAYLWTFLGVVLIVTAVFSGIYPAIYISRFEVVGILKGVIHFGKKNPFTQFFLGLQLILACILITTAVMFTQNTNYMNQRPWGYDKEHTLYAQLPDNASLRQLGSLMIQNPNVKSLSFSQNHLGHSHESVLVDLPGKKMEVDQLSVGEGYLETMGLSVVAGRGFEIDGSEDKNAIIINNKMAESLLGESIGSIVKIGGDRYEVVGVVDNFHMYSFKSEIKPLVITRSAKGNERYLSIKVNSGTQASAYLDLQDNWYSILPETPFRGAHQEDVWGYYYTDINNHGKVWRGIASITVILASLGLFGLVSLNVAGRVREFSIRKVMGAGRSSLIKQIIKPYIILFGLALALAAAPSYILVQTIMEFAYVYHLPMSVQNVLLAMGILISVLFIVVLIQESKVSKSNPVEGLRSE